MYKTSDFLLLLLIIIIIIIIIILDDTTVQSRPSPFFLSLFPVFNLAFLISVCAQFYHLFIGGPLNRLPWWLLLNTLITFLLPSILLTRTIQFNRLIVTNEGIFKSPNSSINFLLYSIYICFFPPDILFKSFLPKQLRILPPVKPQFLSHRQHTVSRNFNFPDWSAALLGE
jgi:hypothetical protein